MEPVIFSDISDDRRCDKVHSVYRSDTSAGKSYGGTSVLSTIIMFAIIQGLYVLREDEEEDIERKITEKTNFQIWISSWRACQTRQGITTKRRRQKEKAAADERMANRRKRPNAAA